MPPTGRPLPSSKQIDKPVPRLQTWEAFSFGILLIVGFALLLYRFPSVPVGLHQDEISEAYESYSLLHTGADRWGYHLPVYFFSWGSGQNVLQAYLTIPVVAVLGLTKVSARLITLIGGLLTLPLFYFTLRRWYGVTAALIGLLFLVLSPWHIMISRWGLENSLVPFFLLLGVYTFGRALDSTAPWWTLICLVPFSLALYTYGVTIVIVPVLLVLLLLVGWPTIRERLARWVGALAIFCAVSSPIFFFCFKNYLPLFRHDFGFERWLPFTVPLLPVTRLTQVNVESGTAQHSALSLNFQFIGNGLSDGQPWSQVFAIFPVQAIVLILALAAVIYLVFETVRERRLGVGGPFIPWLLACVPMIFFIPISISRGIALFLPLIALGAVGAARILEALQRPAYKAAFIGICLIFIMFPILRFVRAYYGAPYAEEIAPYFEAGLPDAIDRAESLAGPTQTIYVTPSILLNYVYMLFYTHTDPADFQHSGATYKHPDFGRYRFNRQTISLTPSRFVFLIKIQDVVQWNTWHAIEERVQAQSTESDDALRRWDAPLPVEAADDLKKQVNAITTEDTSQVMKARDDIDRNDARRLNLLPLCSVPTQITVVGQFLVGRCL
jgi:4-amino-4-deoxy-L-arabinose transferase-like glycosyltransferase